MGIYESLRDKGDVLVGEDAARPIIEASSSGNDTAVRNLLSQPHWIKTMLEEPDCIYSVDDRRDSNGPREVMARPISNLDRALIVAAQNGHAAVVSTLFAFAKDQGIDASGEEPMRTIIKKIIAGDHAAAFKALASEIPNAINFHLPHGTIPLYEAVRLRKPNVVAVLLELGADPLHPVQPSKELWSFGSSLLSRAAFSAFPHITEMLLEHSAPIAHTGALHTAAHCGRLDTMRLLMQHGADVNEVLPSGWTNWTPMHFAAAKGQVDAMKLLEQHGARSDVRDKDGRTPAQLLEELEEYNRMVELDSSLSAPGTWPQFQARTRS